MAEKHDEHEGPIHQAPWVFYLTVAVCYAVLALIMFAKWAAEGINLSDIGGVFITQAALLAAFLGIFGAMIVFANKLIGATKG